MRRILWMSAGAASAIAVACGSFGSDSPASATPDAVDAASSPAPKDGGLVIPVGALDSGAGSADATAAGSTYGAAVLHDVPVAYWRMNVGDGAIANVVAQAPALLVNDISKTSPAVSALPNEPGNEAVLLNDTLLTTADPAAYDFSGENPFTLECWAKTQGTYAAPVPVLAKAVVTSSFLVFQATLDGYVFAFENTDKRPTAIYGSGTPLGGGSVAIDTDAGTRDAWHHYVLVVADQMALFVDGALASTKAVDGRPQSHSKVPFTVGGVSGSDQTAQFVGAVDEVAIYSHPLSPERIAAHFAAAGQ